MRIVFAIFVVSAFIACIACYFVGFRRGINESPLREERQGQVLYAVEMYHAVEVTNWGKLQSFVDTQIIAFTRDYERRFGVPSGTNIFAKRFADAKFIADQVEKKMVPVQATPER